MLTFIKSFPRVCVLAALSTMVIFGAGCATNGRHVFLKEYQSSVPQRSDLPLKGKTICIKGFQSVATLAKPDPTSKPEQPAEYTYIPFAAADSKTWQQEGDALQKRTSKADWREIGNVRNGFGMVLSHVYALNDPGTWLADSLKMDLESLGAKVVGPSDSDSADLCVSGTIQFCRVDIYMKIWGDLVVDLELQTKNHNPSHFLLHTDGGTVAWVGATSEFYKPLRESRQKFSLLTTREIVKALNP
ncbi:MAG: hypothetical protein HY298_25805 [Verrucomicrobia bacterium]|nr:hypothetical protein [Verrucomicrobiota bacterium]